jgi:glucose-1-phosphate cytidylyltransferase
VKVVILAGGLGTRLAEETDHKPKPLVEIGGRPILWHIMKGYDYHGFKEFVIALGYRGDLVKRYFLDYSYLTSDLSVSLSTHGVRAHSGATEDWTIHLVDTGANTQTGGRIKRLAPWLDGETFLLTYGDGVSDVDLQALLQFHRSHGKLATVTAVRPPARYGGLTFDDQDGVASFTEKPQAGEGWISGGFFVLEPGVLEYIEDDATPWESEPLERLASEGQLCAFRHAGFWQSMDTLRDVRMLNHAWESGQAPWKLWRD